MSWLDKLKGLFPKLESIVKFDSFLSIHINCNNSNKTEYNDSSKTLEINPRKLSSNEKEELGKLLQSRLDDGQVLLQQESRLLIEDFKAEERSGETQQILSFLLPIIPPGDIGIWRAALYIRKCFKEGKKIAGLKTDITHKYGDRGRNIANLCTAEYLNEWIIPLYKEFENATDDKSAAIEKFRKVYNKIVEELPFIIFVCSKMSEEQLKREIESKMERNLKGGVKFINIHGIGNRNIELIRNAILAVEKKQGKLIKSVNEENQIIFARLEAKENPPC